MSINHVTLAGNLTRDMELMSTSSGYEVGRFGIAVNERRKNSNGDWEDAPNFFDCTMFGTRAAKLAQYLVKGTKVCVSGSLHWSQWQAKDGSKRSKVDVTVDDVELMSRREDGSGCAPRDQSHEQQTLYDEDIPF